MSDDMPRVWQCECGYLSSDDVCLGCGNIEPDGLKKQIIELERELAAVTKNRDAVIHDLEGKLIEARGNVYESRKWGVALTRTLKNVESTNTTLRTRNAKLEAVLDAADEYDRLARKYEYPMTYNVVSEAFEKVYEAIKAAREAK